MDEQSALKLGFNLKIVPINDDSFPIGPPFLAMFNPETFAIQEDINWTANCEAGSDGSDLHFQNKAPRKFKMTFTLDGTGVNNSGIKIPVVAQVALFRAATTEINGLLHKPSFLIVQYGTFICTCVLNTSEITYTLFDHFGVPLRATVSASFTERTFGTLSNILDMFSSPDLTHRRIVKELELLPVMAKNIYNNQDYYLQVAKVNRIKNFRMLKAGTTIMFPPLGEE